MTLPDAYVPFDTAKIDVWDWSPVDIKEEAQGATREADLIQYKVIEDLKAATLYDVIYDDGLGESADVVGIKVTEEDSRTTIRLTSITSSSCRKVLRVVGWATCTRSVVKRKRASVGYRTSSGILNSSFTCCVATRRFAKGALCRGTKQVTGKCSRP